MKLVPLYGHFILHSIINTFTQFFYLSDLHRHVVSNFARGDNHALHAAQTGPGSFNSMSVGFGSHLLPSAISRTITKSHQDASI